MQIFRRGNQVREVNLTFEDSYQIVSIGQQNVIELYVLGVNAARHVSKR